MGTGDLDESLNCSMTINAILKYIKDVENSSLFHKMSGLQKKDAVLKMVQSNIPHIYDEHSHLIEALIDSLIHVSNHPSILKADKPLFMCCGC